MFILDTISSVCSDPALAAILSIIKKVMNIVWIIGPILAIIGAVIAFVKLLSNPDEKKYRKLFQNMIIALVMLFFLPVIINTVMKMLDDTFEITACWNYADQIHNTTGQGSHYIDSHNKKPGSSIYIDPEEYDTGDPPENSNKNTSTSASSSSSSSTSDKTTSTGKVVFVGDSRTVGMKQSVGSNTDVWSCKSSMGLDWMKSTGIPNVDNQVTQGSKLVILMGVNDLYHVDSYISYINNLASTVSSRGAKVYFVSVNPTSRASDYLNKDIDSFNNKMKSGLSNKVKYIDTNSYLKANGFTSNDGVHYSADTYKKIYTYIKNSL